MSRTFLAAAFAVASIGVVGSAAAADLARPAAPMAQAYPETVADYAFNWSGPYVGANLGYRWVGVDVSGAPDTSFNIDSDSLFGGLQAGYNWQIGHFVYGVETDFGYGSSSDSYTGAANDYSARMSWEGTTRARAGVAFDRFLVYGTAGLAYADVNTRFDSSSKDDWRFGWTAGAGVEYAFTKNMSIKGEYLYADYGSDKNDGVKYDITSNLARIGLNYKF